MNRTKLLEFLNNDRYARLTGIEVIEISEGYCKTKMEIRDEHLNAANVVQGGAIFTLADFAFAGASNSRGQLSLAINANIIILKGKSSGTLFASAIEVAEPKRIGAYDVTVTDENDEVIARFSGLVYRKNNDLGTLK
ncbi:MAG: hotdog fold thioesterase [Prolixibacteraceae bacterium]|nr:hotdog fold thioesterase [Prolixibacteraceae bacterium]